MVQLVICFSSRTYRRQPCHKNMSSIVVSPSDDPAILEKFHQYLPISPENQTGLVFYDPAQYIITPSKNKVSKEAFIYGSQNIVLQGYVIVEKKCLIRGDLANIRVDVHTIIHQNVIVRPPLKYFTKGVAFFPMVIGTHTIIGENSVINSIQIGNYVEIGKNVILGKRTKIRDCVIIEDNVVLPDDTHIPPFTRVKAPFVQVHHDLNYSFKSVMEKATKLFYDNFKPNA